MKLLTIILTIISIALVGCCSPKPITITSVKTDTIVNIKILHDTTRFGYEVKREVTDSVKVLVTPAIETIDTTVTLNGDKVHVVTKKKNTQTKANVAISLESKEVTKQVNTEKQTAIYEPYRRPWYECFIIIAVFILGAVAGFFFRPFVKI